MEDNMTGPEHYEEAERLLDSARDEIDSHEPSANLTAALVHAVLALAAATVERQQPQHQAYADRGVF
jgi:hypothetical protein